MKVSTHFQSLLYTTVDEGLTWMLAPTLGWRLGFSQVATLSSQAVIHQSLWHFRGLGKWKRDDTEKNNEKCFVWSPWCDTSMKSQCIHIHTKWGIGQNLSSISPKLINLIFSFVIFQNDGVIWFVTKSLYISVEIESPPLFLLFLIHTPLGEWRSISY